MDEGKWGAWAIQSMTVVCQSNHVAISNFFHLHSITAVLVTSSCFSLSVTIKSSPTLAAFMSRLKMWIICTVFSMLYPYSGYMSVEQWHRSIKSEFILHSSECLSTLGCLRTLSFDLCWHCCCCCCPVGYVPVGRWIKKVSNIHNTCAIKMELKQ